MKSLLLNEAMVKAWLAGNKTVTRRLMKPQPDGHIHQDESGAWWLYTEQWDAYNFEKVSSQDRPLKPPYRPGETVYIKETWGIGEYSDPHPVDILNNTAPVRYKCGYERDGGEIVKWESPRFMPEWASRSHARIVSVRPERVQEITEEEAQREGMDTGSFAPDRYRHPLYDIRSKIVICNFMSTWESIYPGSWDRNDWLWRIELEKI